MKFSICCIVTTNIAIMATFHANALCLKAVHVNPKPPLPHNPQQTHQETIQSGQAGPSWFDPFEATQATHEARNQGCLQKFRSSWLRTLRTIVPLPKVPGVNAFLSSRTQGLDKLLTEHNLTLGKCFCGVRGDHLHGQIGDLVQSWKKKT